MRAFLAFFKKELLEAQRSGKMLIFGILFLAFGIMNPAIAKLTPWLVELMSEELSQSGMTVTEVTVDALTSWTQFFKNIPMALIAFVLLCGGSFTKEYESNTLVLIISKGFARYKVVLAKIAVMLLLWSAGYWLCFGVTYGYNAYFWDNSVAKNLMNAVCNWWLFGTFVICVMVLFSTVAKSYGIVLLTTGGSVLGLYLLSLLPKLTAYMPTTLMNGMGLLMGIENSADFGKAVVITAALSIGCVATAIPVLNKKQL